MSDPIPTLVDLDDARLGEHLNAVITEQERRAARATIPAQITALAATYIAGGGDAENLTLGV